MKTITICKIIPLVWSTRYGRYVQTDPCILKIGCPVCGAKLRHGCKSKNGGVRAGTCYVRRYLVSRQPIFVHRAVGQLVENGTWSKRKASEHLRKWASS